jgi:single-stranded DNA-binding protein
MQISGRVGGDAEASKVNDQWAIRFSVCHSYSYKDPQGNKKEVATWVRCTMWAKNDRMAQFIKKGDVVYCAGSPKAHGWLDAEKKVRSGLELTVNFNGFEFIHSPKREDSNTNGGNNSASTSSTPPANTAGPGDFYNPTPENVDDLPF